MYISVLIAAIFKMRKHVHCAFFRQENPKFPGILARLEEDPICQRLPLTSFLILPFQRITRLKMLVEVCYHPLSNVIWSAHSVGAVLQLLLASIRCITV